MATGTGLAGETTGITAGALAAKLLRAARLLSGGVRLLVRSVAAEQKMGVVNILLTTLLVDWVSTCLKSRYD